MGKYHAALVVVGADGVARAEEWAVTHLRTDIPSIERAKGGGRTVTHAYSNDIRRWCMATARGMAIAVNERIAAGHAAHGAGWGTTDITTGPFSGITRASLIGSTPEADARAQRLARPGEPAESAESAA